MNLSYAVRMQFINKALRKALCATIKIYRDAIKHVLKILDEEYVNLKDLNGKFQNAYLENLIHSTKDNSAKYQDFDEKFYKLPSYLRREIINTALGIYKSWYSNYQNWLKSDKSSKPPKMIYNHRVYPVFYKDNMYKESNDSFHIKLYYQKDWIYFKLNLRKSDLKYIAKYSDWQKSNPVLEVNGKIFSLRYCFSKKIALKDTPLENQIVIGVDLNVKNTSAVCSALKMDGTVISRKFINCGKEKDHLNKALQIKCACQKRSRVETCYVDEPVFYDFNNYKSYYRRIKYANRDYAIQIARQIVDFAIKNDAYVIIFEHLDKKGKKRFLKEKLHFWNCKMVQNVTASLAHKAGIRINTVCAWGTSKYAYDGSGEIIRHTKNKSICTFANGKTYNVDLSASYNIASRYFIKQIQKSKSEKSWLAAVAKVPSAAKRNTCTLGTLISLNKVLSMPAA